MDLAFLEGLLGSLPSTLLAAVEAQRQATASLDTPSTVLEVAVAIDAVEAATVELHAARAACLDLLAADDRTRVAAMRGSLTQYAQSIRGVEMRGDGGRAALRARVRAEEEMERVDTLTRQVRSRIALVERLVARLPPADPPPVAPGVEPVSIVPDMAASDVGAPPSSSELK